tara:strand:+ start:202 stop:459 length:258 start_codon:yes stop_codon:yes gene_type:complete
LSSGNRVTISVNHETLSRDSHFLNAGSEQISFERQGGDFSFFSQYKHEAQASVFTFGLHTRLRFVLVELKKHCWASQQWHTTNDI